MKNWLFYTLLSIGGWAGHQAAARPRPVLDSLRHLAATTRVDSQRVLALVGLTRYYTDAGLTADSTLRFSQQALRLAGRCGFYRGQLEALDVAGWGQMVLSRFAEAQGLFRQGLGLATARRDAQAQARYHRYLGDALAEQGLWPEATEQYLATLRYCDRTPGADLHMYVATVGGLAWVYLQLQQYDNAHRLYLRGLRQVNARAPGHYAESLYGGLAELENARHNLPQALQYSQLSLQRLAPDDRRNRRLLYHNMGSIYLQLNRYELAEQYLAQALALAAGRHNDDQGLAEAGLTYARLLVARRHYPAANARARESLRLARRMNAAALARDAYQLLADVAQARHDFGQAVRYLRAGQRLNDSLFTREREYRVTVMQAQYANARREQQELRQQQHIGELEKDRQLGWLRTALGLGLAGSLGAWSWLRYRQQRLARQRDHAGHAARQAALQAAQLAAENSLLQARHQLDLKQQELTGMALSMTRKSEFLTEVQQRLDAIARADAAGVPDQLLRLRAHIGRETHAEKDWAQFTSTFEQVHQGFFAALHARYPAITPYELRLAALVKLNLSSGEMAGVLGISEDSVRKARYRLRRRLGLDTGTDLLGFLLALAPEAATDSLPEAGSQVD